jgi:hypothetical protein
MEKSEFTLVTDIRTIMTSRRMCTQIGDMRILMAIFKTNEVGVEL